jgi:hypothetical protein
MEDVRLGRRTAYGTQVTHCAAGADAEIAGNDVNRVSITIATTAAFPALIGPTPLSPKTGVGISLDTGQRSVTYTVQEHGLMVTQRWVASGVGGTAVITVIIGTLETT